MNDVTTIGYTDWRNQRHIFGIRDRDRMQHIYSLGKSGTGKTTLLLNMAAQDIARGNGVAIIDPHGDLANTALDYVPEHRIEDVIYFNATDTNHPIAFNPLSGIEDKQQHLAVSALISALRKLYSVNWGPRLEHILRFCLLTLIERHGSTLLDIQPLLTDAAFREDRLRTITTPHILAFWLNEFGKYSPTLKAEAIAPILNKIGMFTANAPIRRIVEQQESTFSVREAMDSGKVLICNLSKGQIGEDACAVLGSMLLATIQFTALSRASVPEDSRRPFYVYVDEMQTFVTLSLADILAEARKYGLSLFLTHQYIEQLDEKIQAAIFGNVGTLICFRVGAGDARYLEREFSPVFTEVDLVTLPPYSTYLKLLIDGNTSKPFSAVTFPITAAKPSLKNDVVRYSQETYGQNTAKGKQTVTYSRDLFEIKSKTIGEQGQLFQ